MHPLFEAALPLALVLVATFVYAGVAAGSNAYQINSNYDVSHLWEARERLVALAGFALLAYAYPLLHLTHWAGAVAPLAAFGSAACLFGLRFDVRLNLRRGLARDYIGTDPNTAAADKAVRARGLSGKQYALLRLAAAVLLAAAAVTLAAA